MSSTPKPKTAAKPAPKPSTVTLTGRRNHHDLVSGVRIVKGETFTVPADQADNYINAGLGTRD